MSGRSNISRVQFPSTTREPLATPPLSRYEEDLSITEMSAFDGGVAPDDGKIPSSLRAPGAVSDYGSWYYPGGQGQGKLFHDPKPVDEHRWPRGYNPARQAQAARVTANYSKGSRGEPRAWATDVLARSSADLDTFISKSRSPRALDTAKYHMDITDDPEHPAYAAGSGRITAGAQGFFSVHDRTISVNRANAGAGSEATLLHEMGHADSREAEVRGERGRPLTNSAERGTEEARADIFSHRHHVPPKNSPGPGRDQDYPPGAYGYPYGGPAERFEEAYKAEHRAQGVPSPSERTDAARDADEAEHAEQVRRKVYQHESKLFTAYDGQRNVSGGDRLGLYYGHDRSHSSLPDSPYEADNWQMDEATSFPTISTSGVPAQEVLNNRQLAGRVSREDILRAQRSSA